jgi:hypothetical protein
MKSIRLFAIRGREVRLCGIPPPSLMLLWLALTLGLLIAIFLSGCGTERPAGKQAPQALADGKHVALGAAATSTGAAAVLFRALAEDFDAASAGMDLPLPTTTAQGAVLSDAGAKAYLSQAQERAAQASKEAGGAWWAALGLAALGGLGLVIKFGRNLPGVAGVAFGLADAGWDAFAPNKAKAAEQAKMDALHQSIAYATTIATMASAASPELASRIETLKGQVKKGAEATGTQPLIAGVLAEIKFRKATGASPFSG